MLFRDNLIIRLFLVYPLKETCVLNKANPSSHSFIRHTTFSHLSPDEKRIQAHIPCPCIPCVFEKTRVSGYIPLREKTKVSSYKPLREE